MRRNAPNIRRPHQYQSGFTLVEILVAMIIIAILIGALVVAFRSAKTSTYKNEAKATGSLYSQAITQYQSDHANKNPTSADMMTQGGYDAGPKNLLGKAYIGSVPDSVTGGRIGVTISGTCGPASGGAMYGWVTYCPEGATPDSGPDFGIRVDTRESTTGPWTKTCWIGRTTQAPRC